MSEPTKTRNHLVQHSNPLLAFTLGMPWKDEHSYLDILGHPWTSLDTFTPGPLTKASEEPDPNLTPDHNKLCVLQSYRLFTERLLTQYEPTSHIVTIRVEWGETVRSPYQDEQKAHIRKRTCTDVGFLTFAE